MTPRPRTLREIAQQSDSLAEFGRHFQDWLHTVRSFSSRPQVLASITEAPPRLGRRFAEGRVADAWLAAYAEYVAGKIARPVPVWTEGRVAPQPWFAVADTDLRSRVTAIRDSPAPFKSRNLFTPSVDLPLRLAAGRPSKTAQELRAANAARQRRFRVRRRKAWQQLASAAQRRRS